MTGNEDRYIAEIIVGCIIASFTALVTWIGYDKKKSQERVDDLSERVTQIEKDFMAEHQVKELIDDKLLPLRDDFTETKSLIKSVLESVHKIELRMEREEGYRQAQEEARK